MSKPRLVSSKRACAALERLGFEQARAAIGSHQMYRRRRADGGEDAIVVPLGKREIKRWTLKSMLRTGNLTLEEFERALR